MLANTWYTCILDEITKEMSLDRGQMAMPWALRRL